MQRGGCVYIMTNSSNSVLYVGVTSSLLHRVWQHKHKTFPQSFTSKYSCNKLVYYKFFPRIEEAIAEEKRIKAGSRKKKIAMVNMLNSNWADLYDILK